MARAPGDAGPPGFIKTAGGPRSRRRRRTRSGGIKTYLDAKARFATEIGAYEHHLIVPSARERHADGRHGLPGAMVARGNGYRRPLDIRPVLRTLDTIEPDVILLHDAHWWPAIVANHARELEAKIVAVHHGSAQAGALGRPGPSAAWRHGLSAWQRRLYRRVDAVMAVGVPAEASNVPHLPLRYGVAAAFRPPAVRRRDGHVLYAGRLAPEKGIDVLLRAMVAVDSALDLHLVGCGPAERTPRRQSRRLGVANRVAFRPFIADARELARAYARAACVVVPGAHETFGLVALEAAASGASVVASANVPAAREAAALVHTFRPGDPDALADAIRCAAAAVPDQLAAARLSARMTWPRAFEAEAAALSRLVRYRAARRLPARRVTADAAAMRGHPRLARATRRRSRDASRHPVRRRYAAAT